MTASSSLFTPRKTHLHETEYNDLNFKLEPNLNKYTMKGKKREEKREKSNRWKTKKSMEEGRQREAEWKARTAQSEREKEYHTFLSVF